MFGFFLGELTLYTAAPGQQTDQMSHFVVTVTHVWLYETRAKMISQLNKLIDRKTLATTTNFYYQLISYVIFKAKMVKDAKHSHVSAFQIAGFTARLCHISL